LNANEVFMIYATKKSNESNERLISRFKKLVQRSRIIMDTKKGRYHKSKPTKSYVRQAAVMREHHRKQKAKEKFYSS